MSGQTLKKEYKEDLLNPVLNPDDFKKISRKVKDNTGIVLKEHKSVMVQSRVSRRLRELGIEKFKEYIEFLESPEGEDEITHFCNAITTNLTSFFREPHHFDHLKKELATLNDQNVAKVRIWSAGCSTGEEPYCISLIAEKALPRIIDKKILATDLDTCVLNKASMGIYSIEKMDSIPDEYTNSFQRSENEFEFNMQNKSMITFNKLNLLHPWPFRGPFDAIFCRNVLIYFDSETKTILVDRYADMLRSGGVLYLGHSETILEDHPKLVPEGRTTYRKIA